jgi:hypothetical protein
MIVSVEEIEAIHARLDEINAAPFEEITWTKGGVPVVVPDDEVQEWRFIGMSNTSFPEFWLCGEAEQPA